MDKIFLAGAASREGLYVAATRGRESLRIFVPDREAFLDAAGLRIETRTSALEFSRALHPSLRSHLARAWSFLQEVRVQVIAYLTGHPDASFLPSPEIHRIPVKVVERARAPAEAYEPSPRHHHSETPAQGMRMRL